MLPDIAFIGNCHTPAGRRKLLTILDFIYLVADTCADKGYACPEADSECDDFPGANPATSPQSRLRQHGRDRVVRRYEFRYAEQRCPIWEIASFSDACHRFWIDDSQSGNYSGSESASRES